MGLCKRKIIGRRKGSAFSTKAIFFTNMPSLRIHYGYMILRIRKTSFNTKFHIRFNAPFYLLKTMRRV